jgi:hypothetical protein
MLCDFCDSVYEHVADWVRRTVWPLIIKSAVREEAELFAATLNVSLPDPVPAVGEVKVTQASAPTHAFDGATLQEHDGVVSIEMVSPPPHLV